MHWIVQENLYNETGYQDLISTLDKFEIPYDVVKVVPFSHEMIPDVQPIGSVMICGSITLSKIATERGWIPGSFHNKNHDFRVWRQHYGAHLLNASAEVSRFANVTPFWEEFFIRPVEDSKAFSGQVYTWDEFKDWQKRVIDLKETYTTLDANTVVCYGPVQEIWSECRFFVIDKKLVTWSLYKQGTKVVYDSVVGDDIIAFAQQMVDLWQPARAFVMDIALTEHGCKIVEINCLNSAGFYAANVAKLVEAIEEMDYA